MAKVKSKARHSKKPVKRNLLSAFKAATPPPPLSPASTLSYSSLSSGSFKANSSPASTLTYSPISSTAFSPISPAVQRQDSPARMKCRLCSKDFKRKYGLGAHLRDKHSFEVATMPDWYQQLKDIVVLKTCKNCGKQIWDNNFKVHKCNKGPSAKRTCV